MFYDFLDSRATHSFMRMSVIEQLRWATTKVVKPLKVQLAQSEMKPTHKVMFISTKNVMGPSSRQTSQCVSWNFFINHHWQHLLDTYCVDILKEGEF